MRLRPTRVVAVARRDLAMETAGRKGIFLPLILVGLLIPAATVSTDSLFDFPKPKVRLSGDIPAAIQELPNTEITNSTTSHIHFTHNENGVLVLHARWIPDEVRTLLDKDAPAPVQVIDVGKEAQLPKRSLLLALIASSVLSGAVAESLPGERSRRTLETLLAAAISHGELVAGKWLAWAGLGAMAATVAALLSMVLGRQSPGPWLLALPFVPACTVALGMFLVRTSNDLIGGSAVAIRVLPALLTVSGVIAWMLGGIDPTLGALLPLGGALLAAGGLWEGWTPVILSVLSTGTTAAVLLALTSRDIGGFQESSSYFPERLRVLVGATAVGMAIWWMPVAGPALWSAAGNSVFASGLSTASAQWAAAMFFLIAAFGMSAQTSDIPKALSWRSPTISTWLPTLLVIPALHHLLATPPLWTFDASLRLFNATAPQLGVAALVGVLAQELFFRGWVLTRAGPIVGIVSSTLVLFPTQPIAGLLVSSLLAWLALHSRSVWPSMFAHFAAMFAIPLSPLGSTALALGGLALSLFYHSKDKQVSAPSAF